MRWSGLCLAATLLAGSPAFADEPQPDLADEIANAPQAPIPANVISQSRRDGRILDFGHCDGSPRPRPPVSTLRRTGAVLAAIGPGLFIRGTGSYIVHEKRTAKQLAKWGYIGLAGAAVGGAAVGLSGGYPPTMVLMPVLLAGGGMVFTTWWADIAVAAGLDRGHSSARATAPWSVELATMWLDDPFRTTGLLRVGGRYDSGRWGVGAFGTVDAENEIRIGEAEARYRIIGAPPTGKPIKDGSRLVVRAGGRVHTDDGDNVTIATGELEVIGRYDLFHLDRVLAGTFIQLSTGFGIERAAFTGAHDYNSIFLAAFAWGAYLGNRGEAAIFYDHRRDTIIGGLPAFGAAGFVGSLGAYVDYLLDRRFAVRAQVDWGNALITTFGIRVRGAKP